MIKKTDGGNYPMIANRDRALPYPIYMRRGSSLILPDRDIFCDVFCVFLLFFDVERKIREYAA